MIAVYLAFARGPLVLAFAAAGLFISLFYTAWTLKLKYRGLGEVGVFIVWGPLMVGGTYYVAARNLPSWVWLACVPYALAVTTVILGKHLDKYTYDRPRGVRTLAVVLGDRATNVLIRALMVLFYLLCVSLVLTGVLSVWVLLIVFSLPRLLKVWRIYSQPRPSAPPETYGVWPLWFVSWAFHWTKQAGTLFVIGVILGALFPSAAFCPPDPSDRQQAMLAGLHWIGGPLATTRSWCASWARRANSWTKDGFPAPPSPATRHYLTLPRQGQIEESVQMFQFGFASHEHFGLGHCSPCMETSPSLRGVPG